MLHYCSYPKEKGFICSSCRNNINEILNNEISIFDRKWLKIISISYFLSFLIAQFLGIEVRRMEFLFLRMNLSTHYVLKSGITTSTSTEMFLLIFMRSILNVENMYMEPEKKTSDYFDKSPAEISIHILIEEA